MRRISIIALVLALLLCGCGSTAAQPTPQAAASPKVIEYEPEVYDSARDFLSSLYEEYGRARLSRLARTAAAGSVGEVRSLRMAVFQF